jgi:ankyrin repeat protein
MNRLLLAALVPAALLASGCAANLSKHAMAGDLKAMNARLEQKPSKRELGGALILGAAAGQYDAVKLLLLAGADVGARDNVLNTPLHAAAMRGSGDIIRLLKKHGGYLEARDKHGYTPLILAAKWKRLGAVEALLQAGADPNARNNVGDGALHWAANKGDPNIVAALLKGGADPELSGASGGKAHSIAESNGNHSSAVLIRQAIERRIAALTGASQPAQAAAAPAAPAAAPAPAGPPPVIAPSYKSSEREQDFAVVVGVEKYADLPEARFAERDAEAVREHLIALGYPPRNVVVLTGAKATKTGLIKNLETWLPNNVGPDSNVFFFYSGHGAPEPRTGSAYLLPSDGDPQYLEDTGYPLKRLYDKLSALKAKRVVVALDSCFSGAGGRSVLAKGTRPLVSKIDLGAMKPGKLLALTASAGDQISGTDEDAGHGLFTAHLLRGLNGAAARSDGGVTVDSLYRYLSFKVADDARRANREQVPQLFPQGGAEVRLR